MESKITIPPTGEDVKEAALRYLEAGLSVIPLRPRGKEPLLKWSYYQRRRPSEEEVEEWFTKHKGANIGIVAGEASGGLCIIDIDTDGEDPQRILEEVQKRVPQLLEAPVVKTRRGLHLYVLSPGERGAVISLNGAKLELRRRGYVVAPPSVHPSGLRYRWLRTGEVPYIPDLEERLKGLTKSTPSPSLPRPQSGPPRWSNLPRESELLGKIPRRARVLLTRRDHRYPSRSEQEQAILVHLRRAGFSEEEMEEVMEEAARLGLVGAEKTQEELRRGNRQYLTRSVARAIEFCEEIEGIVNKAMETVLTMPLTEEWGRRVESVRQMALALLHLAKSRGRWERKEGKISFTLTASARDIASLVPGVSVKTAISIFKQLRTRKGLLTTGEVEVAVEEWGKGRKATRWRISISPHLSHGEGGKHSTTDPPKATVGGSKLHQKTPPGVLNGVSLTPPSPAFHAFHQRGLKGALPILAIGEGGARRIAKQLGKSPRAVKHQIRRLREYGLWRGQRCVEGEELRRRLEELVRERGLEELMERRRARIEEERRRWLALKVALEARRRIRDGRRLFEFNRRILEVPTEALQAILQLLEMPAEVLEAILQPLASENSPPEVLEDAKACC